MSGERPEDAQGPDETAGTGNGQDGLEARRASDPDAPFHGLRSAADIFGAPRASDEWPSRRERREAIKAAQETGAPLPEPFEPPAAAPVDEAATPAEDTGPVGDGATQAISMPEELAAPSENPVAAAEHERAGLRDRIPPAAAVPPTSTASHPSAIQLPTAQSHRDDRVAEAKEIDAERRRVDPFGLGLGDGDVDWLGRATGTQPPAPSAAGSSAAGPSAAAPSAVGPTPSPTGPVAQPIGVGNVLPPTDEPPSFTDLLRVTTGETPLGQTGGHERPFDWAIRDDETGEVPTTLTSDRFDTTALAGHTWTLADESDSEDEVVSGEVDTPETGIPVVRPDAATTALPPVDATAAPPVDAATTALPVADPQPSERGSWSLADDAPVADDHADADDDVDDARATTAFEPPRSASSVPDAGGQWWAEPDAVVPPTAVPPLVEPAPGDDPQQYPAHLPPAVGQDLDAIMGIRRDDSEPRTHDDPAPLPSGAPDDLDQSEWTDRETSDTSAIKDIFGTAAVDQLGASGYDPHDNSTRMMPAVGADRGATTPRAAATPEPSAAQQGIINEQFAKLQGEGKRGKQLLIGGSVVLILLMLVAVFFLARWIMGNNLSEHLTPATKSPAAASAPATAEPSDDTSSTAAAAPAQSLQFATTPAAPGEHPWTELDGGECLSPFEDAWAETFTVVDCSAPHLAQLTARLQVSANAWPGPDTLSAQASERCQSAEALDASAAAAVGDVQVQGSYAPDQETWDRGDVFISCFVSRSSGGTLTGSLAPSA
uniref:Septum formation family protein n=1 Tax=Neobacillus citreus TaxID=2833578 RepID=A0A942SXZ1_9BACI